MSLNTNIEQDAQFAADFNADVTREELARVYAEALCGACDAKSCALDDLLEEYGSLLHDALDVYPKFEQILSSAIVPVEQKTRIVAEAFAGGSELFRSFLRVLAKRSRLDLLRDIYAQARAINDKRKGRVPVTITTAAALDAQSQEGLVASLRKLVGGEPEIRTIVDPETIGGIIVRVGDTVYDASIATQLNNVRQQMIDRSTHEIQSRR
ncbi:MAG: ATP synthase F1 subunit delta, partial [Planctomycetia bacterium]|nr:ATP synthase F1 subunit delta [Planctomycetia bacterium]